MKAILTLVGLAILVAIVWAALAWHSSLPRMQAPPAGFDAQLVDRGARLAAMGDCITCHTAPGGEPYAGGRALETPFGTIHGTNITPDPRTGIGAWTEAAFVRAMREGVDRGGRQLYPAFPYDRFTHMADEDLSALYAFLMTREPVERRAPANDLRFPLGFRSLVAWWNLLFLKDRPFQPDATKGAEWNRGAYLAEGVAHCGSCHSPRNVLGAEKRRAYLAGGEAEGWTAPALDRSSPARVPWSVDALVQYLRTGVADSHPIAAGPMAPVVRNLAQAPEDDVRAIAIYIADMMGTPSDEREAAAKRLAGAPPEARVAERAKRVADDEHLRAGAELYTGACASCHDAGRGLSSASALDLSLSTAVAERDPRNLVRIIREGVQPLEGERGRWMPAFEGTFTDDQMTSLVAYLRTFAEGAQPWRKVGDTVKRVARDERREAKEER